jgi:hypothetical protein
MEVQLKIKALTEGFEAFKKAQSDLAAVNAEVSKAPKATGANELAKTYESLGADVRAAYKELRLVPDAEVKAKIYSIRSAYDTLAASGQATDAELQRAQASMESQIGTLERYGQAANDAGGGIGTKIAEGAQATVQGLTDVLGTSYSAVTQHSEAVGGSLVGLGLLAKKTGLSFGSDLGKAIGTPFAMGGAAIADMGLVLLKWTGYVYLGIAAIKTLVGIFTGDAFKNETIDTLSKQLDGFEKIGNQLGLNATKAQTLVAAFERLKVAQVPVSQESYLKAGNDLSTLAKRDPDGAAAFDKLGVQNAALLTQQQLIEATAVALGKYTSEKDRQAAADTVGIVNAENYIAMTAAVRGELQASEDELRQYNLLVGQDGAEAFKLYETAVAEFSRNGSLTTQGFKQVIADSLMPILTDLAVFFKEGMPNAIAVFRVILSTAIGIFQAFVLGIYTITESILGSIKAAGEAIAGLGKAMARAMVGDFNGAWAAIKEGGNQASNQLGKSFDNIAAKATETNKKIRLAVDGGGTGGDAKTRPKAGDLTRTVDKPTSTAKSSALGVENDLEAARFAALKLQLEAQIKLVRDALGREQRELDTAFAEGLTSIKDYYVKRASITQAGIDAEIALKEKEIAAAKKAEAAAGTDEKKKLQLSGQRAQLEADLTILQRKRADVATETERSTKKATDEYAKSIDDLKIKLTELTGVEQRTAAERRAALTAQYELQLKKAQAEDLTSGTGTQKADLVTKVMNLETVKADFAVVEREYQKMLADMQAALKEVDLDPSLTTIERIAKQDSVRAAATISLESKRQELQTLIEQSQATLNLSDADVTALTDKTKALGQEIQGLKPKVVDLGTAMRDTFQNAIGNELAAVITKTKTAKEAMIDLAKTMLAEFAKVASQNFMKQIFGGSGGGYSGSSGGSGTNWGSMIASWFGYADGGHVQGAGTGTSDSIPAMLSNGEFVQTANAVQHYGLDFMEAIRSLKFPKLDVGMLPRFAKGGLAGLQSQQVLQRFAKGGQVSTQRVAQAQRFATGGFVQANQAAVDAAATPNITVNIVNNGTPQRSTDQSFDVKSQVLSVFMEDMKVNGPMAQAVNGVTGTQRRR